MTIPVLFFYGFAFVGLLHSIVYSILAIRKKRAADLLISLYLLVQSLIIVEYVFFWSGLYKEYHYFNGISFPLMFLFGPLLFMYIEYAFSENRNSKRQFFHFIPALLVFIFMLPYFFAAGDLKINHVRMIKYLFFDLRIVPYIIMVHMSTYFVVIVGKVSRQKRVGHINTWLHAIVFFFGFYILCYSSYYYMITQPWFTLKHDYFVSLGMCGSIVAIIYLAYGKNKIFDGYGLKEAVHPGNIILSFRENPGRETAAQKKNNVFTYDFFIPASKVETEVRPEIKIEQKQSTQSFEKYKNSGLTEDALNEVTRSLQQLMQKEKLYRESELKLETLSSKLGISKHHVSQVINQIYGVNFFEYINLLRIEEAKQLLAANDKKSMNIIEVAYAVGYSTKNTFNTAFRRIVGVTPTEYRSRHQVQLN